MIDKELLNKELLNIFKKKKILAYELYKEYLKGNYEDIIIDNRIYKLVLNMYLSSLPHDDRKALKTINNTIFEIKNNIQKNLLATVYETRITNNPQTFYNNVLKEQEDIIALRDKNGFYGIDKILQELLNEYQLELKVLHSEISNKEQIMNGDREIYKHNLCRSEVLILSNYLGYGSARDDVLKQADRAKVLKKQ